VRGSFEKVEQCPGDPRRIQLAGSQRGKPASLAEQQFPAAIDDVRNGSRNRRPMYGDRAPRGVELGAQ